MKIVDYIAYNLDHTADNLDYTVYNLNGCPIVTGPGYQIFIPFFSV